MERLLVALSAGTTDLSAISGSSSTNKGLDKLTDLAGLCQLHTNMLFGIYLNQRQATIQLKGYLLINSGKWFNSNNDKHKLKLLNGAIRALKTNSYRLVQCYKCSGIGSISGEQCAKCKGIGQSSVKPKEYDLCGFSRSFWYNKKYRYLRESFKLVVNMLLVIDGELKNEIAIKKRDNS